MKTSLLCISLGLMLAPAIVQAQSRLDDRAGGYVVGGIGTQVQQWNGPQQVGVDNNWSGSRLAYTFGGGLRLHRNFAVEANYYGMSGQVEQRGVGGIGSSALSVSALGILPIGKRTELFARIGTARMQRDFTAAAGSGLASVQSTDVVAQYGAGINTYLGKRQFIRAEWNTWGTKGGEKLLRASQGRRYGTGQLALSYGMTF